MRAFASRRYYPGSNSSYPGGKKSQRLRIPKASAERIGLRSGARFAAKKAVFAELNYPSQKAASAAF